MPSPTNPQMFADPYAPLPGDAVEGRSPRRAATDSPQRMPSGQRIAQQMYERVSVDEYHVRAKRQADSKTSPRATQQQHRSSGPHFLVCYLCGQQFSKASLGIHQPQCYVKQLIAWERGGAVGERGPKPVHPDEWHHRHDAHAAATGTTGDSGDGPLPTSGRNNVAAFNEVQAKQFNEVGLSACENCGRTFLPDRLVVHQRSCKPGNAAKPVRVAQPSPPPPTNTAGAAERLRVHPSSVRRTLPSPRLSAEKEEIVVDDDDGCNHQTADQRVEDAASNDSEGDNGVEGRSSRSRNDDDTTDGSEGVLYMSADGTRRGSIVEGTESTSSCDKEALLRAMERTVGPDEPIAAHRGTDRTPPPVAIAVPVADAVRQRRSLHETPLLRCQFCKRTFAPDRLERHEGACVERKKPTGIVTSTTASTTAGPVPQHRVPLKASLSASATRPSTARNHNNHCVGNTSFGNSASSVVASASHPRSSLSPGASTSTPLGYPLRDDLRSPSSTHSYRGSPMEIRGSSTDRNSSVVTPPPGPQHPRFCTECGQKLYAATQKFCGECGTRVVAVRSF